MTKRKPRKKYQYTIRHSSFAVLFFFIFLWIAGIVSGEAGRVLEQAKQICLSCIGIG